MLEKFISFVYVQRNNFLKFTTVTQHGDRGWNRTNIPIYITPSLPIQPMKICTTPLAMENISYSLGTVAWALLCPTRIRTVKEVWHVRPMVFSPYPRRLECLKAAHSQSVISRPWVLVRPGFEPITSHLADQCLSNQAKRAAVCSIKLSNNSTMKNNF